MIYTLQISGGAATVTERDVSLLVFFLLNFTELMDLLLVVPIS